ARGARRPPRQGHTAARRSHGRDVRPRRACHGCGKSAGRSRLLRRACPRRWTGGRGGSHRTELGDWRLSSSAETAAPQLGLRANLAQFVLLVAINALVGGMLGQERIVLPLLADQTFHIAAYTRALTR